jgi:hypothetical protein
MSWQTKNIIIAGAMGPTKPTVAMEMESFQSGNERDTSTYKKGRLFGSMREETAVSAATILYGLSGSWFWIVWSFSHGTRQFYMRTVWSMVYETMKRFGNARGSDKSRIAMV